MRTLAGNACQEKILRRHRGSSLQESKAPENLQEWFPCCRNHLHLWVVEDRQRLLDFVSRRRDRIWNAQALLIPERIRLALAAQEDIYPIPLRPLRDRFKNLVGPEGLINLDLTPENALVCADLLSDLGATEAGARILQSVRYLGY